MGMNDTTDVSDFSGFNVGSSERGDGVQEVGRSPEAEPVEGDSYELLVLGDTHYDAAYEVYHAKYQESDERLNRIQREEFARNERLWRVFGPRLLGAMQGKISEHTRAVVQVGDLVQGDCGDPEVHGRMLLDTLGMFHERFPGVPFVTVVGNHDIRGPGAEAAYRKTVLPYLSKELGQTVESTTFSFMLGSDLVVCIDFNAPNLTAIQAAFDAHPEARYKFVLTHGPVIPIYTATTGWFLLGWSPVEERRKIRELLLRNDVIVLTGHEHAVGFSECQTDAGRISQLMTNSVWSEESLKELSYEEASPAEVGRIQETRKSEEGLQYVAEYKDSITRHWFATGAGYCVLKISPQSITADFYGGDISEPIRTVKVR